LKNLQPQRGLQTHRKQIFTAIDVLSIPHIPDAKPMWLGGQHSKMEQAAR
jgi:hypothetical protein